MNVTPVLYLYFEYIRYSSKRLNEVLAWNFGDFVVFASSSIILLIQQILNIDFPEKSITINIKAMDQYQITYIISI